MIKVIKYYRVSELTTYYRVIYNDKYPDDYVQFGVEDKDNQIFINEVNK